VDVKGSLRQAKGADWEEPKAPPSRANCLSCVSHRFYVSGTTAERSLSRHISTAPILSGADWGLGDLAKSPVCCVTDSWLCGLPYKVRVPDCPEREVMLVTFTRHDASHKPRQRSRNRVDWATNMMMPRGKETTSAKMSSVSMEYMFANKFENFLGSGLVIEYNNPTCRISSCHLNSRKVYILQPILSLM